MKPREKRLMLMKQRTLKKVARWLPLLVWMALIFLLSDQPRGALPEYGSWDLFAKKGAHMVGYAALALLARYAGLPPLLAWLLAFLYAVSDEFHQTFVPGRNGTVTDVFIDTLGAGLGLGLVPTLWHQFRSRWIDRERPPQSGQRGEPGGPSPHDV